MGYREGRGLASLGQVTNKLQPSRFPAVPEGEKIAFTLYLLIFFHSAASKSIPNRLSDCLDFRREVARLWLVSLLVTFSPSSFSQGLDRHPRLSGLILGPGTCR